MLPSSTNTRPEWQVSGTTYLLHGAASVRSGRGGTARVANRTRPSMVWTDDVVGIGGATVWLEVQRLARHQGYETKAEQDVPHL